MTRHVLKNNEVQLAGSFQLNMGKAGPTRPTASQPESKSVRVRLAETHPEFAIVEVTCSCGQITLVRCEYAAVEAPSAPAGSEQA